MPKHDPPVDPHVKVEIPNTVDPIELAESLLGPFATHAAMLMLIHHHLTEHQGEPRCPKCNDNMPSCEDFTMIPQNVAHRIACEPFEIAERVCDDCLRANAHAN